MFPYLFSHNMTCPQTSLNFNAFKFANSILQRFIKHTAKGTLFWSTIHFRDSSVKYFSWCRFDLTVQQVSWKKIRLDSVSRSDTFVTSSARENIWIDRCILMLPFFNKKSTNNLWNLTIIFCPRGGGQILKTNTVGNIKKNESICLLFPGSCTKCMFSFLVVFWITIVKGRSAARNICFAYKRIHQFSRQVDIYIANNSRVRLPFWIASSKNAINPRILH